MKLLRDTHTDIRATDTQAEALAQLSWEELLEVWHQRQSNSPLGPKHLKPKADPVEIASAESRLQHRLPKEIREFFYLANGICEDKNQKQEMIVGIEKLVFVADWKLSLSQLLDENWKTYFGKEGEPRALRIFGLDYLKLMNDQEDLTIPYSDVDNFVALNEPNENITSVFVLTEHKELEIGTILLIENGVATQYSGLKFFLANDLVTTSFGE